ncbi:TonB-dependent receptor [Niveispirillum sp.]|uniref:TonB-dependent receptor n=1 Tax=Niveispirillum sp. TaxID=1917217 RepID=UPI001B4888C3|nr:TonB-dependent receptor [Niveispirillum sp.]MBP7338628.1 TonB-dependent receptor [Niveispirillum sp.]
MRIRIRIRLLASAALMLVGGVGQAQPAAQTGTAVTLEEIIVTAERRTTSLQDTPVAVTAIKADQLQSRGVQTVRGLENLVPGLSVGSQTNGPGANSATFWIRGLGQLRAGNGSEPSVPLYIDDFYYPGIAGNVLRAMDIEQVEVLRGPQGTLFGRNSTGGAVRYQTRQPGPDLGGFLEGTYGSYDRTDLVGALNIPLDDNLAVRLSGASMKTDGYVKHVADDEKGGSSKNKLFRIQVRYQPVDALTLNLSYEEADSFSQGSTAYIPVISPTGTLAARWNARPGNLPRFDQSLVSRCTYCNNGGLIIEDFDDAEASHLHFTGEWEVNDHLVLKLLSGRSVIDDEWSNDIDGTPAGGRQYSSSRVEAYSHELQAQGDIGDRLNYVAGIYYYDENFNATSGQLAPNAAGLITESRSSYDNSRESISAYTNITFSINDRLKATGGLRVGEEKIRINTRNILPATGASDAGSLKETMTLPLARLQYDWGDNVMTYLSVSRGARAGGFNIVPANADAIGFNSEDVTSYEGGARMAFLNRRMTVNPTVFYTDYNSMQINRQYTPPPPAPPSPTSILENAGKAHIYGVELESSTAVTNNLRLMLSGAFMKGAFDELNPQAGVKLDSPLPRLPRWFYSMGAMYDIDHASGGVTTINLDYAWRSAQYGSASDVDAVRIAPYGLLNGQIEHAFPNGQWKLAVFATNLADRKYLTGGLNLLSLVGVQRFDMGRPREIGIRLRSAY